MTGTGVRLHAPVLIALDRFAAVNADMTATFVVPLANVGPPVVMTTTATRKIQLLSDRLHVRKIVQRLNLRPPDFASLFLCDFRLVLARPWQFPLVPTGFRERRCARFVFPREHIWQVAFNALVLFGQTTDFVPHK